MRLFPAVLVMSGLAFAQAPAAPLSTHQVNADGTITFRYFQPAERVSVRLNAVAKPLVMTKADGVWSVTSPVLPPEVYAYTYNVDGKLVLDPASQDVAFNYEALVDQILVPGTPAMPWELTAIPHGRVDHQRYLTKVGKNFPDNESAYVVYTPPGYDAKRKGGYPVLYLLHGWSDNEIGWTQVGRADMILDSLIASGKAVPMIVVMPLGYGNLDFVKKGFSVWQDPVRVDDNTSFFTQELESEVMPAVERSYNTAAGRENRAIAGLSMGGLETLSIGLNHSDQFAYVASMSAAVHNGEFDRHMPGVDAKTAKLKLLWVGCGTSDGLLKANREFVAWAKGKGFDVKAVETPGAHTWLVWRDNLVTVAPLLFR